MKYLPLLAFVSLLLPVQAFAMTTPVLLMNPLTNLTNSGDRFFACTPVGASSGTGSINGQTPIPAAGTLNNISFGSGTTITTGSYAIHINKNGTNTSNTCTLDSTHQTCTDTAHPISFAAGDLCAIDITPTGTPTAQTNMQAAMTFDGTNSTDSIILGSGITINGSGAANSLSYNAFGFTDPGPDNNEIAHKIEMPTAGTIDKLYFFSNKAPGAGTSWAMTVRQNNATTTITCTESNTTATCNDTTHSISVNAGDFIDLAIQAVGTPAAFTNGFFGVRFTPTIPGESVMIAGTQSSISSIVNSTLMTGGKDTGNDDVSVETIAPVAFTWKKLFVDMNTAPGSGASRTFVDRINGSSGTITTTVSNTNTSGNDTTHNDSVAAGNVFNWLSTPTNSPTGSTNFRISGVMSISSASPVVTAHLSGFFAPLMRGFFGPGMSGYFL